MCRQNHLLGCVLMAFGVGILIGMLMDRGFICGCIGFGMIVLGFFVVRRK